MNNIKIPTITLAGARNNVNLSQVELAKELGMTAKTYIEYEKYNRVFRVDRAKKFSKITRQPFESIIFLPQEYISFVHKAKNSKEPA